MTRGYKIREKRDGITTWRLIQGDTYSLREANILEHVEHLKLMGYTVTYQDSEWRDGLLWGRFHCKPAKKSATKIGR